MSLENLTSSAAAGQQRHANGAAAFLWHAANGARGMETANLAHYKGEQRDGGGEFNLQNGHFTHYELAIGISQTIGLVGLVPSGPNQSADKRCWCEIASLPRRDNSDSDSDCDELWPMTLLWSLAIKTDFHCLSAFCGQLIVSIPPQKLRSQSENNQNGFCGFTSFAKAQPSQLATALPTFGT
ncbi:hypothetical protein ACLKA7_010529 [Drosophila subpalustris]